MQSAFATARNSAHYPHPCPPPFPPAFSSSPFESQRCAAFFFQSLNAESMAGAPLGNQNAAKGRRMARIFEGICAEEEYKRITQGINAQLDAFAKGDLKAGEFVRDTTDGKPSQQIDLGNAGGEPFVLKVESTDVNL